MSDAFELDKVDVKPRSQEGVEMELLDPARKPTGVILIVRGTDSDAYKTKMREQIEARANQRVDATFDQRNREFWELHATLVAGWKGRALMLGGKPLAYSQAAAAQFLEQYDWAYEQVREFANRRQNFLPGPARP
jgi:murein L,D-transpeptidase YafK